MKIGKNYIGRLPGHEFNNSITQDQGAVNGEKNSNEKPD